MNRRSALKTSFFTAASTALFGRSNFLKEETSSLTEVPKFDEEVTYLLKSGHPKNDNVFAFAVFKISNLSTVSADINKLFEAHRYKTELKYSSNDRYKLELSKELMDYASGSKNIIIDMHVFNSNTSAFSDISPAEYRQRLDNVLSNLNFKRRKGTMIKMKKEDNFGPSSSSTSQFLKTNGKKLETLVASEDRVMQFCDLMCGTAVASITDKKVEGFIKKELIKHFRGSSGINRSVSNRDSKTFKIHQHKID